MGSMEQMILGANFMHTEAENLQFQFSQALSRWEEIQMTVPQLKAAFKAAQSKICHPHFPPEDSSGYTMGSGLLATLMSKTEDLIRDELAKPEDFHETYLELLLALIKAGPLSSHIEYIRMVMSDTDVEFEEFFQTLRGNRLKTIVLCLKKEYKPDQGREPERFFDSELDSFWRVVVANGFTEEQCQEARKEFVELYTFFTTAFGSHDEVTQKAMHDLADTVADRFDGNIFQGTEGDSHLRQHLKALTHIILAPGFPQTEDSGRRVKNDLRDLLDHISKQGLISKMYDIIMDLALDLTVKKAGCEGTHEHFKVIGYFFYHLKDDGIKGNGGLYEGLVQKFIHFLKHVRDEVYLTYKFVIPVTDDCLIKAMGTSEKDIRLWLDMVKALLKLSIPECIDAAWKALREQEKLLKWKKYPDDLKEIFGLLVNITFPKWLNERQLENGSKCLEKITIHILNEAKKVGIVKMGLTEPMVEFAFHCLEMANEVSYSLADAVIDRIEFNAKKDKKLMMECIQRVTIYVEDDSYDWDDDVNRDLANSLGDMVHSCIDCVKDGKLFTWDEYDDLIYLAKLSEIKVHDAAEPGSSFFFMIYVTISTNVFNWLQTMNESHRLIPMVPSVIRLLDSDNENLKDMATAHMTMLSRTTGAMFARYMDKMITMFLEDEQSDLLYTICNSYEYNMGPVEKNFDKLFEHVDSGNMTVRTYILQLMPKVAKHQPQLFTTERVRVLMKEAKEDPTQQIQILMMLGDVAKHNVDLLEPYMDDFMNTALWEPMSAHSRSTILQLWALEDEEKAEKVIKYMLKRVETSQDHSEVLISLNACRLIGFKHRAAIEKYRDVIEKFRDSTDNNDYHTTCSYLIDMLDGKSVGNIAEELRELQGDVAALDERVTATEQDIVEVKGTVQQQGQELENVKNDVTEQGQRLDQVEDTVQDTVVKVQEIDNKTLSHAPYWARDVSKLLNVESDTDWRLLALRLGFSNDDIRSCAMHSDPCLAMFDQWYATHNTREATHAVLTSLHLLDREDAAVIVENAMKNADAVVEDEEFEYATPPDIFLSYQWGHQDEVRLLRQHLEMAGFSCWMDVGQMGGGDKLFEKIDKGIRGAKVVISCVTAKYAKSPNCNREVNLSVNLGKPILPLLMEKTIWPPPGSMGPIFSEYLFIRFFQRAGEETTDQRYWPLPKFQELLMQLSVNGVKPDEQVVQPEYKDWWLPKVEEVTIDKDRTKKQSAPSTTTPVASDDKTAVSPDIFISYQWGKQPQIVKLYKTLTSLGYSCWLDIMQMGGGDSLYDKIDRGLRGCRVVLSCITTKYAKSANCRREVSLADAVKKPLVPLLLESLSWPPPGPMSPILTQLLYIDCTRDSMEETWTGPKFDELLAIIDQHVPGVHRLPQKEKIPEPQKTNPKPEAVPEAIPFPAPVASSPGDGGDLNNSNSQQHQQSTQDQNHLERKEEERVQEQEYAPPPSNMHGREKSNTSSMDSNFAGHDACNLGQQNLMNAGMMANTKSSCCVVQ